MKLHKELDAEVMDERFFDGVASVTAIRCAKHLNVMPLNRNELDYGECGACIAEKVVTEAVTMEVVRLRRENDVLKKQIRKEVQKRLRAYSKTARFASEARQAVDRYKAAVKTATQYWQEIAVLTSQRAVMKEDYQKEIDKLKAYVSELERGLV